MFGKGAAAPKSATAKKGKGSVDEKAVEDLFNSFADEIDPDAMTMDGISTFAEKLDMDPSSDVRLLVLLWKMNAVSKPGTVLRKEFVNGMMNVFGKDSIEGLKSAVPSLDPGFLERSEFRDFYKFVFQFSREGTHKTIEKDMILALLTMVLDKNRAPHLDYFVEFLKGCSHQRITLDQWDSFLQFQHSIKVDLSNYDEDGACKC
jgi:Cullin binding